MHGLAAYALVGGRGIQLLENFDCSLGWLHITDDAKLIAAGVDLDAQALFQLAQVLVELAAQVGQPRVVSRFEFQIQGNWSGISQGSSRQSTVLRSRHASP